MIAMHTYMAPLSNSIFLNSKLIQLHQYNLKHSRIYSTVFSVVFSRAYVSKHVFEGRHVENIVNL